MTDKIIRGSGGPPPTPPSPTRAPDTLNSRQFASIQDLLSEGEIEGFATPSKAGLIKGTTAYNNAAQKDIFLNDTPILNASASNTSPATADFNFQNVSFAFKEGTANQTHISGIVSSESTTGVGTTVTTSAPVTRQITNTNVDAAKVTITFPQLQKATDQGDLLGSSVQLNIQIQYQGAGFNNVFEEPDTITGRSADAYQKEYRITFDRTKIDAGQAFPVDIRVVRITADSTSDNLKDEFAFTSISEIIDDKQTYPNSAYTNLRLDSEQFSSIPKRAFRIRGVKVRIPGVGAGGGSVESRTPTVDIQTGRIVYPANYIFNGTMGAAVWCSCPAMILLDLLTTERYGFGTHITDSSLDLQSFVAASRYANEQVNDSRGGLEARFSCNVNIQGTSEAYTLINELAGVMRAFPIWQTGSITLTQDKPTDPSYLFSLANVGEGGFSYSGSSLKQRHTVISVSYFNMDSREIDYEVVEDTAAQAKLGIIKKDVKAFACTSRGQAFRLGKAILFSEQQESEIVSFTTSIDAGAIVRPGSVIRINDPVRSGVRRSGRLKSINTAKTQITVDNAQDLSDFMGSGTDHKCSVMLPDGTLEAKNISSTLGIQGSVIHLDSALSQTPNVNTIWLLHKTTSFHQTFRVITVEEQDDINYAITALTYLSGKYANIEQGTDLPDRNISLLNQPKNPPSNLQASERIAVINALAVSKIILSWVPITGVTQYLVQYRFNNTNWISETVFRPDFEIINSQKGAYEFRVFSYNAALKISATSTDLTFNAVGKTEPPDPVANLSIEPVTNKLVRLRWDRSTDADVIHGGRVYVRHSNLTDGSGTFQNSVDLITALSGNSTDAIVPFLEGEYILKYEDDNGNFSTSATSIIIDLPDLIDTQTIITQREDLLEQNGVSTPFSGNTTNTTFNSTVGALQLTNPANNATGEYEFASIVDLGAVFSLELKRKLQVVGFNIGTDIETLIPGLPGIRWDDYATDNNFDGAAADEASCQIQVATSQTASGNFSAFNNFANGTFKGRRFKFKLILSTTNTAQNINVQQAGFIAQFQSRTEQNYQTGSGTSTAPQNNLNTDGNPAAKTVTFGTPFFVGTSSLGNENAFLPTVGITIENAQSGDFFTVTNISGTGFTVNIKNGSSFVNRNFTFQAVGYGKGV